MWISSNTFISHNDLTYTKGQQISDAAHYLLHPEDKMHFTKITYQTKVEDAKPEKDLDPDTGLIVEPIYSENMGFDDSSINTFADDNINQSISNSGSDFEGFEGGSGGGGGAEGDWNSSDNNSSSDSLISDNSDNGSSDSF